jgi:hypothetical protein
MKKHSSRSSASCSIDRYASTISKIGIKGGLNYANQNGSDITVNSTNYDSEAITSYQVYLRR